jgi:hypothetical protein
MLKLCYCDDINGDCYENNCVVSLLALAVDCITHHMLFEEKMLKEI